MKFEVQFFMNNLLTLEEVKNFLGINQEQVEKFLEQEKLHAYKIGGTYLRFRKEEILTLHSELLPKPKGKPFLARVGDFWRFNNFYLITLLILIALAVLAVRN